MEDATAGSPRAITPQSGPSLPLHGCTTVRPAGSSLKKPLSGCSNYVTVRAHLYLSPYPHQSSSLFPLQESKFFCLFSCMELSPLPRPHRPPLPHSALEECPHFPLCVLMLKSRFGHSWSAGTNACCLSLPGQAAFPTEHQAQVLVGVQGVDVGKGVVQATAESPCVGIKTFCGLSRLCL